MKLPEIRAINYRKRELIQIGNGKNWTVFLDCVATVSLLLRKKAAE